MRYEMQDKAIVSFIIRSSEKSEIVELEIPLDITANDLITALNSSYHLGMDIENIFNCYLASENPIALLKGNKLLSDYEIHNGSRIIFTRE